jgi:Na+/H+-translocating membrane pyrophosphatase
MTLSFNYTIPPSTDYVGMQAPQITVTTFSYTTPEIIAIIVMTYICAIVVHEVAHYYVLRNYRPDTSITYQHKKGTKGILSTGTNEDYDGLSPEALSLVYGVGVVAGAVFILIVAVAVYAWAAALFIPYLMQCDKDIKLFRKAFKDVNLK